MISYILSFTFYNKHKCTLCFFMFWHQVALILLFTSQLTILKYYLCALDTFLRLLMRAPPVIIELQKSFWRRAGFKPTKVESCNLWGKRSTSKPPWLDVYFMVATTFIQSNLGRRRKIKMLNYYNPFRCSLFQLKP